MVRRLAITRGRSAMPSPTITRSSSVCVSGSGSAGTSLMWKQASRSPESCSRSSTEPPPRIMWKTSATTVARGSPVPAGDRPGAGDVLDAVDEAEELHRGDHAQLLADRHQFARTAQLARSRSTTSCGGLATM